MTKVPVVLFHIAAVLPAEHLQVVMGAKKVLAAWAALQHAPQLCLPKRLCYYPGKATAAQ